MLPRRLLATGIACAVALSWALPVSAEPRTDLISRTSVGDLADGYSYEPAVSGDGRFVAFTSEAVNLGGRAGHWNVFLRDEETGETRLVSRGPGGEAADGNSYQPAISANGRFVAFASDASDLGGRDGYWTVYVYDRLTESIRPVTRKANRNSYAPSISRTGRFVAFTSDATNLSRTRSRLNVYVHNRATGRTRLASLSSRGRPANGNSYGPAISAGGRFVAFTSRASNLGRTRGTWNVFVHDRRNRTTGLVSRSSRGRSANGNSYDPAVSRDGRLVAFYSDARNLGGDPDHLDVFVRNRRRGRTVLVSATSEGLPAGGDSYQPSISADGRYVAFSSAATNLGGDPTLWNVFLRDRRTGQTRLMSQTSDGADADDMSWRPAISADGRFVAFESYAPNLGAEDGLSHLFVRGPLR